LPLPEGSPFVLIGMHAFLAVWAANEEIVWRRIALGELLRFGMPAALLGSSVAFAVVHRSRVGTHLATGAAFRAVYLLTGALAASLAAPWAYNALGRSRLQRLRAAGVAP